MEQTERSPKTIRLITALLLLATFVVGIATGVGLTMWMYAHFSPPPKPPPMLRRLPLEELSLSDEQWQAVRECVDSHRTQLERIVESTFPQVSKVNEEIEKEVRALLTAEQKKKLDELEARREHDRPRGMGPPGKWDRDGSRPFMGPPGPPPGRGFPQGPPPPFRDAAP